MRWWILVLIVVGNVVVVPLVNHVQPVVIGMPFFLFWILLWMVLTPFLTWWIYALDNARSRQS